MNQNHFGRSACIITLFFASSACEVYLPPIVIAQDSGVIGADMPLDATRPNTIDGHVDLRDGGTHFDGSPMLDGGFFEDAQVGENDASARTDAEAMPDASSADATSPSTDAQTANDASEVADGGPIAGDATTNPDAAIADSGVPDPNRTDLDFDCDGVSDAEEFRIGTNPSDPDTDADGIIDGIELGYTVAIAGCAYTGDADPSTTTNPQSDDSDGDGIVDGFEDQNRNGRVDAGELDPNLTDTDADGLADAIEDRNRNGLQDAGETDGSNPDSDGDGLLDGIEDANGNGYWNFSETSPLHADTDSDGLNDGLEDRNHNGLFELNETNPRVDDTDGDGLLDGCEDADQNGVFDSGETDPRIGDSDSDGLDDGVEDANQNCRFDAGETDPLNSDTDCDGLSDGYEVSAVFSGGRLDPLNRDTDQDLIYDGVEVSVSSTIAGQSCATVVLDADPTTGTNPTDPDSDQDGRNDGCEDQNRNGRVDFGELNPLSVDTDGDGIDDATEDANGNCIVDGSETNGASADSDGDGIGDAVEIAIGTSPINADTDGDGLSDGVEDANQNGIVDSGETNALLADTDGDGVNDGAEDANQNGVVDVGETNPRLADSDGDGLSDGAELTAGTDPLNPDTDGDGLNDSEEGNRGTNPLNPDTDNDGFSDGDEVLVGTDPLDANDPGTGTTPGSGVSAICSDANLKIVSFHDGASGSDWRITTEASFVYTGLTVSSADTKAAAIDDTTHAIAGFVAQLPYVNGVAATAAGQTSGIRARLASAAMLNGLNLNNRNSPRITTSHDGFETSVGAITDVTSPAMNAAAARNLFLSMVTGLGVSDFTVLPTSTGANATEWIFLLQVLVRTSPDQLILMGAVLDRSTFDDVNDANSYVLSDLTGGTALARNGAPADKDCDPFTSTGEAIADFIWMADTSGSTNNDRARIIQAASSIFDELNNNGVDFRMAVVPHSENEIRYSAGTGGDLRGSGFTISSQSSGFNAGTERNAFVANLDNRAGRDGCEYGLDAAFRAVNKALPRTAATAAHNRRKLRENAVLAVVYISDEHAQSVEEGCNNVPSQVGCSTGILDVYRRGISVCNNIPSAAEQSCVASIVQPFIDQLTTEGGIAFAQVIDPNPAGNCNQGQFSCGGSRNEPGRGYIEVTSATGGSFYSPCSNNPGASLQQIVDAVTGAASEYTLSAVPISSTLKVGITPAGTTMTTVVPRDKQEGFDYDAVSNTVFFRGTTFRPAVGDSVTVSYRVFDTAPAATSCAPPLILNTVTGQCECPSDCGTGGCGAGYICDRDPSVCACTCAQDCGGICGGNTVCDNTTCSCECAANCGGACSGNLSCDSAACACVCEDSTPGDSVNDCNGACINLQVCDEQSCSCACPTDCGGCGMFELCDITTCECVYSPP